MRSTTRTTPAKMIYRYIFSHRARAEKDHVPLLAGQVGGILQGVGIDILEHVQGGRGHVSADARTVD